MKILYAIQGTGNGHLMRAIEIIPYLRKIANVEILISGTQTSLKFPFEINYQYKGGSFMFGKNGGIDYWETFRQMDTKKFINDAWNFPSEKYDLIISDFEPVSAWSAKYKNIPVVSLSHQSAVLNPNVPKPLIIDPVAYSFLKAYAPTDKSYGFHFKNYDKNIYTPIIRKEIRKTDISEKGHITVYLPAFSDEKLFKKLNIFRSVEWQVFSKNFSKKEKRKNVTFFPTSNLDFIKSMASSNGVMCGAGFETPAEALYLNKKVLVIPMRGQFEQECNAYALKEMGATTIKKMSDKGLKKIEDWIDSNYVPQVNYENQTKEILQKIILDFDSLREKSYNKIVPFQSILPFQNIGILNVI